MEIDSSTFELSKDELINDILSMNDYAVSTELRKLDCENYDRFIEEGSMFWHYLSHDEMRLLGLIRCQWVKIRVTYVRSHCFFYVYEDFPEVEEQFCATRSIMTGLLHPVVFEPAKWGFSYKWRWDDLNGRVQIIV